MKKNFLYLMHVDWEWIKQRPQFLADELSNFYNIYVLYSWSLKRKNLTKNDATKLYKKKPLVPASIGKGKFISSIATILNSIIVNTKILLFKPEYIWITHPKMYLYISKRYKKTKHIIYDCMDDVLGFTDTAASLEIFRKSEEALIRDSKLILCSSENLISKLSNRYSDKKLREKTFLMRNGIGNLNLEMIKKGEEELIATSSKKEKNIYYIGTVESWIDFELIDEMLLKYPNIHFHIIGPYKEKFKFKSKNYTFYGPKKHSELFKDFSQYDALIMPFKVNDLILSVDPVKLYEYLVFNKPVISVGYPEVDRFKEYIYLYKNKKELDELFSKLSNSTLSNKNEYAKTIEFLKSNEWSVRALEIKKLLER